MKHLNMTKKPSNVAAELAIGISRLFTKEGETLDNVNTGLSTFKTYCTLQDKEATKFSLEFISSKSFGRKEEACKMHLVLNFPPITKVYEEHKVVSVIHKFLFMEEERRGIKIFGGAQVRNFPRIIDGVGRTTKVTLTYIVEVPRD